MSGVTAFGLNPRTSAADLCSVESFPIRGYEDEDNRDIFINILSM